MYYGVFNKFIVLENVKRIRNGYKIVFDLLQLTEELYFMSFADTVIKQETGHYARSEKY